MFKGTRGRVIRRCAATGAVAAPAKGRTKEQARPISTCEHHRGGAERDIEVPQIRYRNIAGLQLSFAIPLIDDALAIEHLAQPFGHLSLAAALGPDTITIRFFLTFIKSQIGRA